MTTSDTALLPLLVGAWQARALQLAAELGVANQLASGPRLVTELARDLGLHADALYRLLRALAQIGVFRELDERRFASTEASTALRTDIQSSLGPLAAMLGADWQWRSWAAAGHSIRTGHPAAEHVLGIPLWRYLTDVDPRAGEQFAAGMTALSAMTDEPVAAAVKLPGVRTVVDVAGGQGVFLTAILARNPHIERAVLFDQPHVVGHALGPFDPRVRVTGGDMLEGVPPGADAYLLKNVLHNWDDDTCAGILANIRRAMPGHGRVFAAEVVLQSGATPPFAYLLDLHMLVTLHGRERGTSEMHSLFAAAGLSIDRTVSTGSLFSVIEAIPALPAGRASAGQPPGRCTSRQGQTQDGANAHGRALANNRGQPAD